MSDFKAPYNQALASINQPGSPYEVGPVTIGDIHYQSYINAPTNFATMLQQGRQFGDQQFIIYQQESWSFNDFYQLVDRISYQLVHHYQCKPGDHIAIAMRNYPEWMAAYTAIASIGAVVVPMNSWWLAGELATGLIDAQIKLLFCDQQRFDLINQTFEEAAITAAINVVHKVVVRGDSNLTEGGQTANNALSLQALLANTPKTLTPLPPPQNDPEQTAMIMFTSGTSGKPKGAVFSHRSLCQSITNLEAGGATAYMTNMDAYNKVMAHGWAPKALLAVPLFHVSGLFATFIMNLRGGRSIVPMYKWDAEQACRLIEAERIGVISAAPSMVMELLESPAFANIDKRSLLNISGAGAASPPKLTEGMKSQLPDCLSGAGWGMTETGAAGCFFTGYFFREKPHSCGFPNPIVELKFCDEQGQPVPAGSPGEIWLKSPTNINGYWNQSNANQTEFDNGWFRTGDVGYLDQDDCLIICDRIKNLVIRGGENIYPVEIENCLQSCPGIIRSCVFGIPDEQYGEALAAVIQVQNLQKTSVEVIKSYCQQHLASYKVPTYMHLITDDFPVNATNKVLKQVVKKHFVEQVLPSL